MNININGNMVVVDGESTIYDIVSGAGLMSREIIAAMVNQKPCALTEVVSEDCDIKTLTASDDEGKHIFRHTASHILAQATKRLFPSVKLTIGPAIESGFYYDFDSESPLSAENISAIESEMKKIFKENLKTLNNAHQWCL